MKQVIEKKPKTALTQLGYQEHKTFDTGWLQICRRSLATNRTGDFSFEESRFLSTRNFIIIFGAQKFFVKSNYWCRDWQSWGLYYIQPPG